MLHLVCVHFPFIDMIGYPIEIFEMLKLTCFSVDGRCWQEVRHMAAANSASDLDAVEQIIQNQSCIQWMLRGTNLIETTLSLPKLLQQSVTAVFWGYGNCRLKQTVSKPNGS